VNEACLSPLTSITIPVRGGSQERVEERYNREQREQRGGSWRSRFLLFILNTD